jgi:hypothetical protein
MSIDELRLVEEVVHEMREGGPAKASPARRPLGMDDEQMRIADDFDAPLPDELQRGFEGDA